MPRLPRSFQTIYHRQPINFFLSKPSAKVLKTANQRHKRHKLNPSILPRPTNILLRSPPASFVFAKQPLGYQDDHNLNWMVDSIIRDTEQPKACNYQFQYFPTPSEEINYDMTEDDMIKVCLSPTVPLTREPLNIRHTLF